MKNSGGDDPPKVKRGAAKPASATPHQARVDPAAYLPRPTRSSPFFPGETPGPDGFYGSGY